jgi:hypothetical protein
MSVTYSPKDLYTEVHKIYSSMYETPITTEGSYLKRVDDIMAHIQSDLGMELEDIQGSATFIIVKRLSTLEMGLFGETDVVVQDDVTVVQCIKEARRIRKRLARRSRYCPFY